MTKKLSKGELTTIVASVVGVLVCLTLLLVILAGYSKKKDINKLIKTGKKNKKGLGKVKDKLNSSKFGAAYQKFAYYINPKHWNAKHYNPSSPSFVCP